MGQDEIPLVGGNVSAGTVRTGETVRKPQTAASPNVHMLLQHLEASGFTASPRFLGLDDKDRAVLSFVKGETGVPPDIWLSDAAMLSAARLLRRYHDATFGFTGATDLWAYRHPDPDQWQVICHNDFAPYNMAFENNLPTGIFDFDLAGPGPRLRDVAYLAFWTVPLAFDADDLGPYALTDLGNSSDRLKRFCQSYGVACNKAVLDMVRERLLGMHDVNVIRSMIGEAATARLKDGGHLDYWQREAAAFDNQYQRLLANIS